LANARQLCDEKLKELQDENRELRSRVELLVKEACELKENISARAAPASCWGATPASLSSPEDQAHLRFAGLVDSAVLRSRLERVMAELRASSAEKETLQRQVERLMGQAGVAPCRSGTGVPFDT
ncbi:unnamed protein product, partial [Discosporangium mesarthrocarpum]